MRPFWTSSIKSPRPRSCMVALPSGLPRRKDQTVTPTAIRASQIARIGKEARALGAKLHDRAWLAATLFPHGRRDRPGDPLRRHAQRVGIEVRIARGGDGVGMAQQLADDRQPQATACTE